MAFTGLLTPASLSQFPYFVALMLMIFLLTDAGVIGWTAAIAAYGPFIFATLIGNVITRFGSPIPFFLGIDAYYVIATGINWWYCTRKGCEKPS
jgi:NNP family nitrate/nitrite transporter-like MFS transporter